jgi:hypothetical protein
MHTKISVTEEYKQMLEYFAWAFWFLFGACLFWFLTRAKKSEPLTLDEAVILWKIHRLETDCKYLISKVELITDKHSREISGFKCACGYSYTSSRLLVQRRACKYNMFASLPDTQNGDIPFERGSLMFPKVKKKAIAGD